MNSAESRSQQRPWQHKLGKMSPCKGYIDLLTSAAQTYDGDIAKSSARSRRYRHQVQYHHISDLEPWDPPEEEVTFLSRDDYPFYGDNELDIDSKTEDDEGCD